MACKNKWWPHNWLCLNGLYWIFVVLFYITFIYTIYFVIAFSLSPMVSGALYWNNLMGFLINACSVMLGFLTVAAVLKALRKIKNAVAPCCCETVKEEVVVVTSQDK